MQKQTQASKRAGNPMVNGFRLDKDLYKFYQQRATADRRDLTDMIRIALEDQAVALGFPSQRPQLVEVK